MPPAPGPSPVDAPPSAAPRTGFAIAVPDALLARARAGERAAFEQLCRAFERPVYTLALRLTGDRELASEALQETMLKLVARVREFRGDGGSPFWGWLRQIAVNEALMQLRRGRRFALELVVDDDGLGEDPAPPPAAAADAARLQRALAELPALTRSVLWLYHGEGYTHEEIAALMQRTASFSKSQLARGTRRLRVLLHVEDPIHA